MYTEFIIIYVGLVLVLAVNIIILVLLLKSRGKQTKIMRPSFENMSEDCGQASGQIAICKKCATRFSASQKKCPRCGTIRK